MRMRPLVLLLLVSPSACVATCAACEVGEQFALRPCDGARDTVCANCTECVEGQAFERHACEGDRDTVCQPCAVCEAGRTFAAAECGLDADRVCAPCTRCASLELTPCAVERDAACGTRLALRFESERPASAFTAAMRAALAAAVAKGLGLPDAAVEAYYRRGLFVIQVKLRLLVEVNASRLEAVDWDAVARASGLPIQRLSAAILPLAGNLTLIATNESAAAQRLWLIVAWFGVAGLLLLLLVGYVGVRQCRRRRTRVAHDDFTDIFAAAIVQTSPVNGRSRDRP